MRVSFPDTSGLFLFGLSRTYLRIRDIELVVFVHARLVSRRAKMGWNDIPRLHRHNVETLRRSPAAEISGALGDLGTLLPLMITLAVQNSIDLSTTLVFSGFFNVATGVIFGIPLPVQPMKVCLIESNLDLSP